MLLILNNDDINTLSCSPSGLAMVSFNLTILFFSSFFFPPESFLKLPFGAVLDSSAVSLFASLLKGVFFFFFKKKKIPFPFIFCLWGGVWDVEMQ